MKKDFEDFLKSNGLREFTKNGRPSTVYNYSRSIERVCEWENMTWNDIAHNINKILIDYGRGGIKEHLGNESNSTVINALRRYEEFITACPGIKVIHGYESYDFNYPIFYDRNVPEKEKIPGLKEYIYHIMSILLESRGRYVLKHENLYEIERVIHPQTRIPIILSAEKPTKEYRESDEYLARKIHELTEKKGSDTSEGEILRILKSREFTELIQGMYIHSGAEKFIDVSFQLENGDRPYIVIYYKNFRSTSEDAFKAEMAMCLAHEFFHLLHNILAIETFNKKGAHRKNVIEALADFSSVIFLQHSFGCLNKNACLDAARNRYNAWIKRFGSSWPYANALYFYFIRNEWNCFKENPEDYYAIGSIDKFNDVLSESCLSMSNAYDILRSSFSIYNVSAGIGSGATSKPNTLTSFVITSRDDSPIDAKPLTKEEEEKSEELYDKVAKTSYNDRYLLPVHLYDFLSKHSNTSRHFSQGGLVDAMEQIYDLKCDRKTIGKAAKRLAMSNYGIMFDARNPKEGYWYDKDEDIGFASRGGATLAEKYNY